jgi:hypothetical protein
MAKKTEKKTVRVTLVKSPIGFTRAAETHS